MRRVQREDGAPQISNFTAVQGFLVGALGQEQLQVKLSFQYGSGGSPGVVLSVSRLNYRITCLYFILISFHCVFLIPLRRKLPLNVFLEHPAIYRVMMIINLYLSQCSFVFLSVRSTGFIASKQCRSAVIVGFVILVLTF